MRELLDRYGLHPKKAWGQCFLHDVNAVARIVDAAALRQEETVVEIGAGLGAVTAALCQQAKHVIAIERDRDLVDVLQRELGSIGNLTIEAANALTFDYSAIGTGLKIVGNLPYHISSQLLFHLLDQRACFVSATLMLQRELAQRLVAPPGSRTYGAPSVICQQLAETTFCFSVGRGAFIPAPQVESSVIQLRPRHGVETPALFSEVVHAAFGQRRKTLKRALSSKFDSERVSAACERSDVDQKRRAEELSVAEFCRLAEAFADD